MICFRNKKGIEKMNYFIKDIIFNPKKFFGHIKEETARGKIWTIFTVSLLWPFIKSFFMPLNKSVVAMQFSINPLFRLWLNIAKYPVVTLVFSIISYFLFVFAIYIFMKIAKSTAEFKLVFWGLASISILGIVARILGLIFNLLGLEKFIIWIFYFFYIWVLIYSSYIIKNIFKATWFKSILIFITAVLIFIPFAGLLSIAPYLIWL